MCTHFQNKRNAVRPALEQQRAADNRSPLKLVAYLMLDAPNHFVLNNQQTIDAFVRRLIMRLRWLAQHHDTHIVSSLFEYNFCEVYGACVPVYLCVTKGNATKPTDIVSSKHIVYHSNCTEQCTNVMMVAAADLAMRKNFRNDTYYYWNVLYTRYTESHNGKIDYLHIIQ